MGKNQFQVVTLENVEKINEQNSNKRRVVDVLFVT